jgi:hypothetical protein
MVGEGFAFAVHGSTFEVERMELGRSVALQMC